MVWIGAMLCMWVGVLAGVLAVAATTDRWPRWADRIFFGRR